MDYDGVADGLACTGTFVEFEWHSFEADGDLDFTIPGSEGAQSAKLVGVSDRKPGDSDVPALPGSHASYSGH